MKKRLLIFSDSLALPRSAPEVTRYEDTYPYFLKDRFEVFQFSKGGGLMGEFIGQLFYYKQYSPDIVLLQIGIVDCAPRAFSKFEEEIFSTNAFFRKIRVLLSKYKVSKKIRSSRRLSWTKSSDYKIGCETILKNFPPPISVYALSILPPSPSYEEQVPGITKKIDNYNNILKSVFGNNYIDLSSIPYDGVMSDHHHLNKNGHKYVFNAIMNSL